MNISKSFLVILCGALVITRFACAMDNKLIEKIERLRNNVPTRLSFMVAPENEATFKAVVAVRQVARDVFRDVSSQYSKACLARDLKPDMSEEDRQDEVQYWSKITEELSQEYQVSDQAPVPEEFFNKHALGCLCGSCYQNSGHVPLKRRGILLDVMSFRMLTPWGIASIFKDPLKKVTYLNREYCKDSLFEVIYRAALFQKLDLRFYGIGTVEDDLGEILTTKWQPKDKDYTVYRLKDQVAPFSLFSKSTDDLYKRTRRNEPQFVEMVSDEVNGNRLTYRDKVSANDQKKTPLITCRLKSDRAMGSLYELVRAGDITVPEHEVAFDNMRFSTACKSREVCEDEADIMGFSGIEVSLGNRGPARKIENVWKDVTPEDCRNLSASEIKLAADCAWKVWQLKLNEKPLENQ